MQPDIQALDSRYIAGTYRRFPAVLKHGKGSLVYDENEKEYIDLSSGIAVNTFGYADDAWQAAVTAQLGTLQHTSNLYYSEPCAVLASMLCGMTGMSRVFFSNSGAEANECAIKVARKYAQEKKGKAHYHIITLENSFHGRTITTLAATGQAVFHRDFTPLTEGFHHVPAGDLAGVQALLDTYPTAAVMLEVVQGEGGVIPLDKTYVKALADLLCARDVLLICDEVQIGNGRSGMLYGYMNYGIRPDIFTTAKGLGGGLPIGAAVLGEKVKARTDARCGDRAPGGRRNPGVHGKGRSGHQRQRKGAAAARAEHPDAASGTGGANSEKGLLRRTGGHMNTFKGRDFLKLLDFTPTEIGALLELSAELKSKKKAGVAHRLCEGKNLALIFEKTSTRTRCAFEVAARDLGMGVTYLDPTGSQIGKKESIADTARVLSGMFDGIEYRGFGQSIAEELARYASVPVFNGLTDEFHPTQILADFLTVREHFGRLKDIRFTYMGDARFNMGNSLMVGCAKMGLHFTAGAPKGYFPDPALIAECEKIAKETGATLRFCEDPAEAARDAQVIYTDVWVSMGEADAVWAERIASLSPYQVNEALMKHAAPDAIFMHCLPAYHDKNTAIGREKCEKFGRDAMEVSNGVFESPQSVVFEEAENRMHTIKAVLAAMIGGAGV